MATRQSLLFLPLLAAVRAAPWAGQQRVTLCDCTNSSEQAWSYPALNQSGPVNLTATGECLTLAEDGCAWSIGTCIELAPAANCSTAATPFLVYAGKRNGTVTMEVQAPNLPPGWSSSGCMDTNADSQVLELYP